MTVPTSDLLAFLRQPSAIRLDANDRLDEFLQLCRQVGSSGLLMGPTQTGKKLGSLMFLKSKMPPRASNSARHLPPVPGLFVSPEDGSSEALFRKIIEKLTNQEPKRKTFLRKKAIKNLVEFGVEILFVTMADRLEPETWIEFAQIKNAGTAVIAIGSPKLSEIRNVPEIGGLFRATHIMPTLQESQIEQYLKKYAEAWSHNKLDIHFASDAFAEKSVANLCRISDGRIGILDAILRAAAISALNQNKESINRLLLDTVSRHWEER